MYCQRCGYSIPQNSNVCTNCGLINKKSSLIIGNLSKILVFIIVVAASLFTTYAYLEDADVYSHFEEMKSQRTMATPKGNFSSQEVISVENDSILLGYFVADVVNKGVVTYESVLLTISFQDNFGQTTYSEVITCSNIKPGTNNIKIQLENQEVSGNYKITSVLMY